MFQRCNLCRSNHNNGRKHVYSRKHVQSVDTILEKFLAKIQASKRSISDPVIQSDKREEEHFNFWCYFCSEQLPRDILIEELFVQDLGILQHIASIGHKEKMIAFWRDNHLGKREMGPYFLLDEDFQKFQSAVVLCVDQYRQLQGQLIQKEADKIRSEDARRRYMVWNARKEMQQAPKRNNQLSNGRQGSSQPVAASARVKTIAAHGSGLTCIGIKDTDKAVNNIHTGAVPPWLREDDDDDDANDPSKTIGPTEKDFQKHLEQQRKRKLPANRIGAKFDHATKTSVHWLPSFGRVWSKNTRSHNRGRFMKTLDFNSKGMANKSKRNHLELNRRANTSMHKKTPVQNGTSVHHVTDTSVYNGASGHRGTSVYPGTSVHNGTAVHHAIGTSVYNGAYGHSSTSVYSGTSVHNGTSMHHAASTSVYNGASGHRGTSVYPGASVHNGTPVHHATGGTSVYNGASGHSSTSVYPGASVFNGPSVIPYKSKRQRTE